VIPVHPPRTCVEPGCGISFSYLEGVTDEDRCYFCALRRRRAQQAAAPPEPPAPPEAER